MKDASIAILRPDQGQYLEALEPPREPLLAEMEQYAAERRCPISDPEVASFLAVTAAATRPRRLVEVGTNIGYGAIVLARAAGPHAKVITLELSADLCAVARGYVERAGLSTRVEVREGDALALLPAIEAGVDLAYIDCVKEDYSRYLELLMPKLAMGGVIVADNVLWRGLCGASEVPERERVRVEALRAFNRTITTHPQLRAVILPLGDGVAYATRIA